MRTHAKIIEDAGGYKGLAQRLTDAGRLVSGERVRFWLRRGVIPPEHWPAMARAQIATLEELAGDMERRADGQPAGAAA